MGTYMLVIMRYEYPNSRATDRGCVQFQRLEAEVSSQDEDTFEVLDWGY